MFIGIHRRNEQDNEHLRANEAPHKKREPANAQNRTFAGKVKLEGLNKKDARGFYPYNR